MNKIIALILVAASLSACTKRALVKDCQKVEGTAYHNCEIVKEL